METPLVGSPTAATDDVDADDGAADAAPISIRPPYGAERIFRASRRSRLCCITKRSWSNLLLVLLFSISMLLHLSQIGDSDAVESFNDVDVEQPDRSADEPLKSNDRDSFNVLLLAVEVLIESFAVVETLVGVTGAEMLSGIWHWRQSIEVFGVLGTDFDGWHVSIVAL